MKCVDIFPWVWRKCSPVKLYVCIYVCFSVYIFISNKHTYTWVPQHRIIFKNIIIWEYLAHNVTRVSCVRRRDSTSPYIMRCSAQRQLLAVSLPGHCNIIDYILSAVPLISVTHLFHNWKPVPPTALHPSSPPPSDNHEFILYIYGSDSAVLCACLFILSRLNGAPEWLSWLNVWLLISPGRGIGFPATLSMELA